MNKKNQLIVFALVVIFGLILMDTFLFGKSESCRCLDSFQAQEECWAACQLYGECVSWVTSEIDGSCYFFDCCYQIENYCEVSGTKPTIRRILGYTCTDCFSCGTWL